MTRTAFATAQRGESQGYVCPACGRSSTVVRDSRRTNGGFMRRRRGCTCGHTFTTIEVPLGMVNNLDENVSQLARETRLNMDTALRSLQRLYKAVDR